MTKYSFIHKTPTAVVEDEDNKQQQEVAVIHPIAKNLKTIVLYRQGTGRVKVATHFIVRLGKELVATGTLGGKYTVEQAQAEFVKNPNRFQKREAFALAQEMKLLR